MDKHLHEMLAGYVDGELPDEQKKAFEKELANNAELRAELEEFRRLEKVTGMVKYADLPLEVWENYWSSLYRKLERSLGWIFFSVGAIILLLFGLVVGLRNLYIAPNVSLWVKIGVTGVLAGLVILIVSFIRERLFAYRRERYREVIR
jgi:hypothetical protein